MKPNYKRKLKAYHEAYPEFRYDSPSTTLEDNFSTSDFNQYEASPSGEVQEVQSSALVEMKGRDPLKEAMGEQTMAQFEEQVPA
jgi:hypothetical protein